MVVYAVRVESRNSVLAIESGLFIVSKAQDTLQWYAKSKFLQNTRPVVFF